MSKPQRNKNKTKQNKKKTKKREPTLNYNISISYEFQMYSLYLVYVWYYQDVILKYRPRYSQFHHTLPPRAPGTNPNNVYLLKNAIVHFCVLSTISPSIAYDIGRNASWQIKTILQLH